MSEIAHKLLKRINLRRHKLKMSLSALAKRSGVSFSTVYRVLHGDIETASFGTIQAILHALGMTIDCRPEADDQVYRESQARKKAKKLVGMVQGTAGLEAQAVDQNTVDQMVNQTVHELLAGSPRKLWAE